MKQSIVFKPMAKCLRGVSVHDIADYDKKLFEVLREKIYFYNNKKEIPKEVFNFLLNNGLIYCFATDIDGDMDGKKIYDFVS